MYFVDFSCTLVHFAKATVWLAASLVWIICNDEWSLLCSGWLWLLCTLFYCYKNTDWKIWSLFNMANHSVVTTSDDFYNILIIGYCQIANPYMDMIPYVFACMKRGEREWHIIKSENIWSVIKVYDMD